MVGDQRIELRWRAFTEPAAPRASPELCCEGSNPPCNGLPPVPLKWRPARESNPSHSMDSGAASSDASQACGSQVTARGGSVRLLARVADPDWCVWSDSNGHWVRPQRTPSAGWGTDAWKIRFGGPGWIQTNAGLPPGRLRGGCRRSLGYWSGIGGHGGTRTHVEALARQPG